MFITILSYSTVILLPVLSLLIVHVSSEPAVRHLIGIPVEHAGAASTRDPHTRVISKTRLFRFIQGVVASRQSSPQLRLVKRRPRHLLLLTWAFGWSMYLNP